MDEGRTLCKGMGAYYASGAAFCAALGDWDSFAVAGCFAVALWLTVWLTKREARR